MTQTPIHLFTMIYRIPVLFSFTFLLSVFTVLPCRGDSALNEERSEHLALQLFLDAENFGPGRVDGRSGEFTRKALQRWNKAHQDRKVELVDGSPKSGSGKKLWGDKPVVTQYQVSDEDLSSIGSLPEEPEAKGKLDYLPYANALEMISEKFHADRDFVKELNPDVSWDSLEVGTSINVPNVKEPFSIASLKSDGSDDSKADTRANDESASREVTVLLGKEIVEVRESGDLIASFPISVGKQGNETPDGDWKVNVIQWMPEFRYDEKMLKEGTRSDNAIMLPPGPNNPVGIVWIGLNADGIGLHGTSNPHDIGRNNSSGCIRLANWDARTLGEMLEVNTSVTVTK